MLHICYVTFTSTTYDTYVYLHMCMCIMFLRNFMYHIYTESKSMSKVWENDCAELLQWQLPQKLQASFRQQWHLRGHGSALELLAIFPVLKTDQTTNSHYA